MRETDQINKHDCQVASLGRRSGRRPLSAGVHRFNCSEQGRRRFAAASTAALRILRNVTVSGYAVVVCGSRRGGLDWTLLARGWRSHDGRRDEAARACNLHAFAAGAEQTEFSISDATDQWVCTSPPSSTNGISMCVCTTRTGTDPSITSNRGRRRPWCSLTGLQPDFDRMRQLAFFFRSSGATRRRGRQYLHQLPGVRDAIFRRRLRGRGGKRSRGR